MALKNLPPKTLGLMSAAGLLVLGSVVLKVFHGPDVEASNLLPEAKPVIPVLQLGPPPEAVNRAALKPAVADDDAEFMKDMREQMDNDRLQQKKIKMLKMQLEETRLQLEQEKAMADISKLEKETTGMANDSLPQGDQVPQIKILYIGGSPVSKQAILAINGTDYLVKAKTSPVKYVEVADISDSAVTVHVHSPQEVKSVVEYKPE